MKSLKDKTTNLDEVNPGYSDCKRQSSEISFKEFINGNSKFRPYIKYETGMQALYDMITEYMDIREERILEKIKDNYSEDVQRWIIEEFSPVLENWLVEEFVPDLLENNNIVVTEPIKIPEVNLNIYR